MANDFTKILEMSNKNNMGLSNTIKRDYGIPLDYSSVQESYEAALAYAQTSTLAYIGQPISVGDTLYVVTDEANGYLKAVGTAPSGDEKAITIDADGKITIKGFSTAGDATLPRKTADGTLEWVAVDTIVSGDGNTKAVVTAAEDSIITVNSVYDEINDTYTYTLDVELPPLPEYSVIKEVGLDSIVYKLTKDGVVTGENIEVPKAYDDTDLANKIATLETNKADTQHRHKAEDVEDLSTILNTLEEKAKTYTDMELEGLALAITKGDGEDANTYIRILNSVGDEISKVDASAFIQDNFLDDVTYDSVSGKVTFTWKMGDNSTKTDEIDLAHLVDLYAAGTGIKITDNAISIDENIIATKQDIEALKISDYAKTEDVVSKLDFENFKTTNDIAIATAKQETLDTIEAKDYLSATDIENKIAEMLEDHSKAADEKYLVGADLVEIEAVIESKANVEDLNSYYKKSETYSQTEINNLLDGIQAGSSESAASVKTQLDSYKNTNDERVSLIEEDIAAQEKAIADNAKTLELLTGDSDSSISNQIATAIHNIPIATENVAGLVKASEDITVETDGKMTISKVSTDVLVQGSEELVLNGGNANIK